MDIALWAGSAPVHLALLFGFCYFIRKPYHGVLIDDLLGRYLYFASLVLKRRALPRGVRAEDLAPGRILACAMAHLFSGRNPKRVQIFFTLYQAAAVAALYLSARGLLGGWASLFASAAFLFFGNLMVLRTFTLNDGMLLNLPSILAYGVLLNLGWEKEGWILLAGIFAGAAVVVHMRVLFGTVLPLSASFFLFGNPAGISHFLLGFAIPLVLAAIYFMKAEVSFSKVMRSLAGFIALPRWILCRIRREEESFDLDSREKRNSQLALLFAQLFPLFLGFVLLGTEIRQGALESGPLPCLTLLWAGCGFAGIFLLGNLQASSFTDLVPPLVLAAGQVSRGVAAEPGGYALPLGLAFLFTLFSAARQRRVFGRYGRELFQDDGTVEIAGPGSYESTSRCQRLARWIRLRSRPEDKVFFWDGEPEFYYYADRETPSPVVHKLGSLGFRNYKDYHRMLQSLEESLPRYMILNGYPAGCDEVVQILVTLYKEVRYINRRFKVFELKDPRLAGKKRPWNPRLNVIVFSKNRVADLKHTLQFLYRNTREDFELTVVERGEGEEVLEWMKTLRRPRTTIGEKAPLGEIIRKAGEKARGDLTAIFAAGQIPPPGWNILTRRHLEEDPGVNMVYPVSDHPALPFNGAKLFCGKANTPSKKEARQVKILQSHQGKKLYLKEAFSHFAFYRNSLFRESEGRHTFGSLVRTRGKAILALSLLVDDFKDIQADDEGRPYKREERDRAKEKRKKRGGRRRENRKEGAERKASLREGLASGEGQTPQQEEKYGLAWRLEGIFRISLQERSRGGERKISRAFPSYPHLRKV